VSGHYPAEFYLQRVLESNQRVPKTTVPTSGLDQPQVNFCSGLSKSIGSRPSG
jgi:hypothetical protein